MSNDTEADDSSELAESGYIPCRACGARISANREACLRCGEPLVRAPETVSLSTISSGRPLLIAVAISVTVVAVLALLWINRPSTEANDVQSLAAPRPSAAPKPSAGASDDPRPGNATTTSFARAQAAETFIDATGVAAPADGASAASRARYEQAVAQNPNDAKALNNLGRALVSAGDRNAAVIRFARAGELVPDNWSYHFNQAFVLGDLQEWERAVSEYRVAARLAPDQYGVQFDLAMALHKSGDDDAAIAQYEVAMRSAPGDAGAHAAIATSLERVGRVADARREFQRYIEMAPMAPDAPAIRAHLEALPSSGGPARPSVVSTGSSR